MRFPSCLVAFVLSFSFYRFFAFELLAQEKAEQDVVESPLCYEGFDYSPAGKPLLGKAGGEGFKGAWIPAGFNAKTPQAFKIVSGSLRTKDAPKDKSYIRMDVSSADVVARSSSNNSLPFGMRLPYYPIRGIGRKLAKPIEAHETRKIYVASLLRPEGKLGEGAFGGFFGFYLDGTDNTDLFVGKGGQMPRYLLEARGGDRKVPSNIAPVSGQTVLLVVKAEFKKGNDRFSLYVNPDPNENEPEPDCVKTDIDLGQVQQIVIYATGAFAMDDFSVVETFADLNLYPKLKKPKKSPPIEPESPPVIHFL